jgi:hypothetical protein
MSYVIDKPHKQFESQLWTKLAIGTEANPYRKIDFQFGHEIRKTFCDAFYISLEEQMFNHIEAIRWST